MAEPVPHPRQVDALVNQPRGMRVPDLVVREPEWKAGLLNGGVPDAVPGVLAQVFGRETTRLYTRPSAADMQRAVDLLTADE